MKKPTQIVLRTDPLPRNEFGKLSRRALREQFWPAASLPDRQVSGA
jgi:acyl-coenzyme A synthetase/AMP-(fatty) acid ligase